VAASSAASATVDPAAVSAGGYEAAAFLERFGQGTQAAAHLTEQRRSRSERLHGSDHEAILRRLAEIAYAARAPQEAVNALGGPLVEQTAAAKLLTEENKAPDADRQNIDAQLATSRLGQADRVRAPQNSAVADIPVVHRSSSYGPRMQHPRGREPLSGI
jgi:hypothetical protein